MIYYKRELSRLLRLWKLDSGISPGAVDFLQRIFSPEAQRPTVEEAMSHPWLQPPSCPAPEVTQSLEGAKEILNHSKAQKKALEDRGFLPTGFLRQHFANLDETISKWENEKAGMD